MVDYPSEALAEAHDALSDVVVLRNGGTDKAIINRLYYACFHAARAVLYSNGFEPKTHEGVATIFGKEIVLAGDATRDDGRFLTRMYDYRQQADYEYTPVDADVDELIDRTEVFVADMERIVRS